METCQSFLCEYIDLKKNCLKFKWNSCQCPHVFFSSDVLHVRAKLNVQPQHKQVDEPVRKEEKWGWQCIFLK